MFTQSDLCSLFLTVVAPPPYRYLRISVAKLAIDAHLECVVLLTITIYLFVSYI
jgi:hypothetical protein